MITKTASDYIEQVESKMSSMGSNYPIERKSTEAKFCKACHQSDITVIDAALVIHNMRNNSTEQLLEIAPQLCNLVAYLNKR